MPPGTIWTIEEDQQLAQLVDVHGSKKWSLIASQLGTKGSKQCRRRWKNFIALEERKQGSWTAEEDAQLLEGHKKHGNKWTLIAQEIGGRTDNAVKNRFAALEKKRKGTVEPNERCVAPRLSDLSAQATILRDQPRHRLVQGPWLEQLEQQQYGYSSNFISQHTGDSTAGIVRKPDLIINIPGATVAEAPYSQTRQAVDDLTSHKGFHLTCDISTMAVANHKPDESSCVLSTNKAAGPNTMAALTSPSEEPGAITSLYKYLCSATPSGLQQSTSTCAPAPWSGRSELQLQGEVQTAQLQQPLPLCLSYSQPLAEVRLEQRYSVPTSASHPPLALQQQAPYQPVVLHKSGHDLQAQHHALLQHRAQQLVPGVCSSASRYNLHVSATSIPTSLPPQLHNQHSLLADSVDQQPLRHQQQLQLAVNWSGGITAAMPAAPYTLSLPSTLPGCGMIASIPAYAPQQQSQHLEEQPLEHRNWGPEELRQLLDLLGDQQQQDDGQQNCSNKAVTGVADSSTIPCAMTGGLEQGQTVINHPSVQPLMC